MHRVTVYHFKIFKIKWNNVYTLKRTEIPLDTLRRFFWHDISQWARASSFTRFLRSHKMTHHSR